MSRIYFHSPSGDTELRGSERANMGILCGNMLVASVGPISDWYPDNRHWLRKLIPTDHWLQDTNNFAKSCSLYMRSGDGNLAWNSKILPMFDLALNTALFSGSDPVKLLARLHAQCEIHCYVTGENRQWLGSIIRQGRLYNVMRAGQGWEDVVDMLYSRNDEPVVCSYSVCEQFPNYGSVPEDHPWRLAEDSDAFYNASNKDQWKVCWNNLFNNRPDLELRPCSWNRFYFGNGLSGFDLYDLAAGKHGDTTLEDLFQEREEPSMVSRKTTQERYNVPNRERG